MTNPMRKWLVVVAGIAVLGALALGVMAAAETGSDDGQATFDQRGGGRGGFQGGGDPFQGGQGGPGFQGGMPGMGQGGPPMGGGGGAAIAVADGKVFVVQGPTIYKFDAASLELELKTTFLERPAGPGAPGGAVPGQ